MNHAGFYSESPKRVAMEHFRVWHRCLGSSSRVSVEGKDNTSWLITRLSQSFVFKSSMPVREDVSQARCSFEVPHGSFVSGSELVRLLGAIPEVRLLPEPT